MKRLRVIYEGWGEQFDLGVLADDGQHLLFEYTQAARERGLELSRFKLPLQTAAFGDFPQHQQRLPGLVADSLPDGWGMLLMDRLFRVRGIDPYSVSPLDRLAVVGHRGMGALSYAPESEAPIVVADVNLHTIADEVQQAMAGASESVLRELVLMGGSPHGARPKVLVNVDHAANRMWNSEDAPGTPWLVKFPAQNEAPEVCAIEMLYSDLVRACGIEMPPTAYFDLGAQGAAFGIARFDREDGQRVPVHTAAGVAHVDFRLPSLDYTNLLRLAGFVTRDVREVEALYARCVFNVIFNNRDDHAKNFSFRLDRDDHWRIAPAYDITFNRGPAGQHQMDIGGEARAPARAHLLKLAKESGVKEASAARIIDGTAHIAGELAARAAEYPISAATLAEIVAAVEANRSRLLAAN